MKELIDFSCLDEAFNLPVGEPVWVDWEECCYDTHLPISGNAGINHTEETKAKISKARKGIVFSEETRRKMSEAAKRRTPFSEETRRKIGDLSAKTYTLRDPSGKIVTVTNLKRFCEESGIQYNSLARVVRGLRLSHKGWTKP